MNQIGAYVLTLRALSKKRVIPAKLWDASQQGTLRPRMIHVHKRSSTLLPWLQLLVLLLLCALQARVITYWVFVKTMMARDESI